MPEVRTMAEGTLRWVQAGSGTGGAVSNGWVTASGNSTGLIGYVQAGLGFDEAFNVQTVMDRGTAVHHKTVAKNPIEVEFTVLLGVTADWPPFVTASGFSNPQVHLEWKMHQPEVAGKAAPFTGTGLYYQFRNATLMSKRPTEAENGNTLAFRFRAIDVNGPTASGYLS